MMPYPCHSPRRCCGGWSGAPAFATTTSSPPSPRSRPHLCPTTTHLRPPVDVTARLLSPCSSASCCALRLTHLCLRELYPSSWPDNRRRSAAPYYHSQTTYQQVSKNQYHLLCTC